ncbi:hypothetical protein OROHE_007834 [Orobanche hederae]
MYAKAEIPTTLPPRCLIDHWKWQRELMDLRGCDASRRFSPFELLMDAKTRGAPLWNGRRHVIQDTDSIVAVEDKYIDVGDIKKLLNFYPIVGVILVKEDFSNDGKKVYEGKKKAMPDYYVKSDGKLQEESMHAVVFLDTHDIDHVTDTGDVVPVTYVAYQNSDGDANNSMCPMGISWLLPDQVVKELHYGASLPPVHPSPPLQSLQQIYDHSVELQTMDMLVNNAQETYDKAEECYQNAVAFSRAQNPTEAELAFSAAFVKIEVAREILVRLCRCRSVYENVNAASLIATSETAKKVDEVHASEEKIKLSCFNLENMIIDLKHSL